MTLVLGWAEVFRAANGEFTTGFDPASPPGKPSVHAPRRSNLPDVLTIRNSVLNVSVNTSDGRFSVLQRRTDQFWNQRPANEPSL